MKTMFSLILAAALTAGLLTGCGCQANVSTHPNGMITEESTHPSIMPHPTATHETTRPHATTLPTVTGSEPATEGGMADESTTDTTMDARHRNRNTTR